MKNNVSVDEALVKGRQMVTQPVQTIIVGGVILTILMGWWKLIPVWGYPVGFLISLALAFLWWSVSVTTWRLWAFEHVRNVHELKKRAIKESIIWPDNHFFEKTEIRSATDKAKWIALQTKFDQKDIFYDDLTVPEETIIYYSKSINLFEMALALLFVSGFGVYILFTAESYLLSIAFIVIGIYWGYQEYTQATNTKPQIILNNKGIQTISTGFRSWRQIRNEEAVVRGSGDSSRVYLIYEYSGGAERLLLDNYETDLTTLNKLLRVYRGRSEQKSTSPSPVRVLPLRQNPPPP